MQNPMMLARTVMFWSVRDKHQSINAVPTQERLLNTNERPIILIIMAVTYRINTQERIVYLMTTGSSSFAEWKDAMLAVLSDPLYLPGFNFLSDRRQETDVPSSESARSAADFLNQHSREMGSFKWAAVSCDLATYGMQRMFSIYSEIRGIKAEAFTDYEEARRWLLDRSSGE